MERYKEFCLEWNNVIPFKIKESDLAFPNEGILTNLFTHYLVEFGFSAKEMKECQQNDNAEVRHKFKVDLCTYINYLYKLGDETSHPFTYFDLISPTPKKTHHVLKYLLNYLLFFNMMKIDVIEPTKVKIQEYKQIESEANSNKIKLEETKLKNKTIEDQLEKYYQEIPNLNDALERLLTKDREQNEIKQNLVFTLENKEIVYSDLKKQETDLNCEVVTNVQAETLIKRKIATEKELKEQNEIEHSTLETNRQRVLTVQKLEEFIKHGNNFLEFCSLENPTNYYLIQKKRSELDDTIKTIKIRNEREKISIQEKEKKIDLMKNDLKEKVFKLKNINSGKEEHLKDLKTKIKEEEDINEEIDLKLHNIEDLLAEQVENENTIRKAKHILLNNLKDRADFLPPDCLKQYNY